MGIRNMDEMIGRSDILEAEQAVDHWKANGLDFSNILYQPKVAADVATRCIQDHDHGLDESLDRLKSKRSMSVIAGLPIAFRHRAVSAI